MKWQPSNIARRKKSNALLPGMGFGISFWGSREQCKALIPALYELGFDLNENENEEIRRGKDFIQLRNGPLDLDLIFAPDGIERFENAWSRRIEVEGFPVSHLDDIIASKRAANRQKDKESLGRLEAFREYWRQRRG